LLDANANRSPTAYLANPPEERARYAHNTDKTMSLLKLLDQDGRRAASPCLMKSLDWPRSSH
jgi:neutral ceramidase